MIEIDLHRTRDGAVVVAHDAELARLGGAGEIVDASLEEVRALDAGEGQRVPLLSEVLDEFSSTLPFNLELMASSRGAYPDLEKLAVSAAVEHDILDQTLFSSFYDPVLAGLRRCSGGAHLGVLVSPRAAQGWLERAASVAAVAVNFHTRLATPDNIERAHQAGLLVNVYTVDDPAMLGRLVEEGVDGIFTNYPDRLRRLLETRNKPS
jgi:glycerophosphoryl diester phosphodiesterase